MFNSTELNVNPNLTVAVETIRDKFLFDKKHGNRNYIVGVFGNEDFAEPTAFSLLSPEVHMARTLVALRSVGAHFIQNEPGEPGEVEHDLIQIAIYIPGEIKPLVGIINTNGDIRIPFAVLDSETAINATSFQELLDEIKPDTIISKMEDQQLINFLVGRGASNPINNDDDVARAATIAQNLMLQYIDGLNLEQQHGVGNFNIAKYMSQQSKGNDEALITEVELEE